MNDILPEDFDGVFRFTNWSDEDFVGIWGGKGYTFPAKTTSPMLMAEHSPYEIQNIRKKFARDLGEREFFKSSEYKVLSSAEGTPGNRTMSGIHQASTYSDDALAPFIQRALEPLDIGTVEVRPVKSVRTEDKMSKNEDGELNTAAVKSDKDMESLAKGTLEAKAGI